jgi:prepilin-type processing-associated H-X9-DG protein
MFDDLRNPSDFALMGDGGAWTSRARWTDPDTGVYHSVPMFQSLHGTYRGFKVRGSGLPMSGPRERGNIMFADGHVDSIPRLWEIENYVRRYYLWPNKD